MGGFWRPHFFGPNSETWSQAAQDMYVGACKVSEFISKNCNLAQSRRKINGKPLFLPREPKKVSFKPFLVTNKTKAVIFRKGGRIGRNDRWEYGGNTLEIVSVFKYLGCYISTSGSFSRCTQELTKSARRALFTV